ncbi:uncharacterized protein LOC135472913 [Liolophura sinensis]|uniref:uncharacterized protein LOC135472913 n=1 Tax=Liolophura sinensis TaxID=3198878 RepID=UPI0031597E8D
METDVTYAKKCLLKQALGLLACGNSAGVEAGDGHLDNPLWTAQKSYHLSPDNPDNMASVVTALHAEAVLTQDPRRKTALLQTELRFTTHLLQGTANLSPRLYTWLVEIHVLALMLTNRSEEARLFISEMHSSENNGRLQLLKEIVESFLSGERTKLAQIISQNAVSTFVWQLLAVLSTQEPEVSALVSEVYRSCLQSADSSRTTPRQTKFLPLIRMAQVAFEHMMEDAPSQDNWRTMFEESTEEVMKLEPNCSAVLLMKALLAMKDNPRLSKHHLQQLLDNRKDNSCGAYVVSLARKLIIQILKETKKDPQALQDFLKDIEDCGDTSVLDWYKSTYKEREVSKTSSEPPKDYWEAD